MLGNPLPGRIQAQEEPWQGPPVFRVTSTFAEHVASGRGPGIDFGNGQCGAEVYACEAGTISSFIDAGNGAVVVRINHGGGLVTGYAHLQSIEVFGQVARGQLIGHVGMTGADACHLHWGVNQNGVEIDGWPLLDQNIMEHDVNLKGTPIEPLNNRMTTLTADAGFTEDPVAQPYNNLRVLVAGTKFTVDWRVRGNTLAGTDEWWGGWVTGPAQFGYVISANCGPLVPIETVEVPGPPVIVEPPPSDVDTALILAEVNKLTVALNDVARARSRAVTAKNNIKVAAGG